MADESKVWRFGTLICCKTPNQPGDQTHAVPIGRAGKDALSFLASSSRQAGPPYCAPVARLYSYCFLVPGVETKEYEILARPGYRVQWEEFEADGNLLNAKPRQIKFITEELVCNWDNSDGVPFKWIDITETATRIATRALRYGSAPSPSSASQI